MTTTTAAQAKNDLRMLILNMQLLVHQKGLHHVLDIVQDGYYIQLKTVFNGRIVGINLVQPQLAFDVLVSLSYETVDAMKRSTTSEELISLVDAAFSDC